MSNQYDVAIINVQPGTHPKVLSVLKDSVTGPDLLACWYSEIGVLNQILIIRRITDARANLEARAAILASDDPFGVGNFITGMSMDIYTAFDFLPAMQSGEFGPCYEVRTYVLKPDGLGPTVELWRKAVPDRVKVSPLLTALVSATGTVGRFMHIWPYKTLDERTRLRAKSVADGVWPPPGGPDHLVAQQTDIFLPAQFSPMH